MGRDPNSRRKCRRERGGLVANLVRVPELSLKPLCGPPLTGIHLLVFLVYVSRPGRILLLRCLLSFPGCLLLPAGGGVRPLLFIVLWFWILILIFLFLPHETSYAKNCAVAVPFETGHWKCTVPGEVQSLPEKEKPCDVFRGCFGWDYLE